MLGSIMLGVDSFLNADIHFLLAEITPTRTAAQKMLKFK